MSINAQLSSEMKRLAGFTGPQPETVSLAGPEHIAIEIDVSAVDSMSCSYRELRLTVPSLADGNFQTLEKWANNLCKRVTYLLENIGPIEFDSDNSRVLIRSAPPEQQAGSKKFYELILQSHNGGNFSLRRYVVDSGTPGRAQVDIQTTHEVLQKLVGDLIETIPAD
jgi:hypothetical protein